MLVELNPRLGFLDSEIDNFLEVFGWNYRAVRSWLSFREAGQGVMPVRSLQLIDFLRFGIRELCLLEGSSYITGLLAEIPLIGA